CFLSLLLCRRRHTSSKRDWSSDVCSSDLIRKTFGSVVALRSGSLSVDRGSIHALIGENGAGKSTLVKIVAGLYQRDSGDFIFDGEPVDFTSTAESKSAGIAVIYQERSEERRVGKEWRKR